MRTGPASPATSPPVGISSDPLPWRRELRQSGLGIFLGGTLLTVALVNQGGEETAWIAIGGQVGLSVALGLMVNRWWAIALSWLPVVIGLPFGYTEWVAGTDADPVWIRELFAWPVYVAAITAGVVIRRTIASRRARTPSGQAI